MFTGRFCNYDLGIERGHFLCSIVARVEFLNLLSSLNFDCICHALYIFIAIQRMQGLCVSALCCFICALCFERVLCNIELLEDGQLHFICFVEILNNHLPNIFLLSRIDIFVTLILLIRVGYIVMLRRNM